MGCLSVYRYTYARSLDTHAHERCMSDLVRPCRIPRHSSVNTIVLARHVYSRGNSVVERDFTPVSLTIGRRIPFKLVGRRSQLELSMKELRREKGAGGSFERAPKRAVDPENSTSSSEPKSHVLWLPHCDPVQ